MSRGTRATYPLHQQVCQKCASQDCKRLVIGSKRMHASMCTLCGDVPEHWQHTVAAAECSPELLKGCTVGFQDSTHWSTFQARTRH
jgi:hypothetical protein